MAATPVLTSTIGMSGGGTTVAQASPRPFRHGQPWTPEEIGQLVAWRSERVRFQVIADRLGRERRACYMMFDRVKSAGRPSYRCGKCTDTKPADEFYVGMRRNGGWCKACQRGGRGPAADPVGDAAAWLHAWLGGHAGAALRSEAVAAGTAEGHTTNALEMAVRRHPSLATMQRHDGDPTSKRTYGWWVYADKVQVLKAADEKALYDRTHSPREDLWSDEECRALVTMRAAGYTARQIAEALGRTRYSVRSKAHKMLRAGKLTAGDREPKQ